MENVSRTYSILLRAPWMIDYSYTCDALGGTAGVVRDIMFSSNSASEFIERYKKSPAKEFYDAIDPDMDPDIPPVPYGHLFYACSCIEKIELIEQALNSEELMEQILRKEGQDDQISELLNYIY